MSDNKFHLNWNLDFFFTLHYFRYKRWDLWYESYNYWLVLPCLILTTIISGNCFKLFDKSAECSTASSWTHYCKQTRFGVKSNIFQAFDDFCFSILCAQYLSFVVFFFSRARTVTFTFVVNFIVRRFEVSCMFVCLYILSHNFDDSVLFF